MNNLPLVSVVLITYNHEKYIAEAIESILSQTFNDLELVIVNDGSTDMTDDVIKKIKDDRIVYIYQENKGPSVALNTGILSARGKYIALLSGDDVSNPNRIEKQLEEYNKSTDTRLIFSYCDFIDDNSNITTNGHFPPKFFEQPNRNRHEILNIFFYKGNFLNPSMFTEKKVFIDAGLFDPALLQLQDFDMWIKATMKYEFYIIPKNLNKYRMKSDKTNLSIPSTAALNRISWEYSRVLNNFLKINLVEDLFSIFPNIKKKYEKINNKQIPFALAMLALENPHKPYHVFAFNTLFSLMSDTNIAEEIRTNCNFTYADFFKLTGKYDYLIPPSFSQQLKDKETQLEEMNIQLKNIFGTYSWKITAPLRKTASFFQKITKLKKH